MNPFKILSLKGGGLRGVGTVQILKRIEALTGKRIYELFDLIAGTSTGGLIACGVSYLYTLDTIMSVYTKRGSEIFPKTGILNAEKDLFLPKYSPAGLSQVLTDLFGKRTIQQAHTQVILTAFDMNGNKPVYFKSRDDYNPTFYDICRATTAAPSYFPSYVFEYPKGTIINCIDGGIFDNDPSLAALAEYSKHHDYYRPETAGDKDINYGDVTVLTVGTGHYSGTESAPTVINKGEIYWAQNIMDAAMRGVEVSTDYKITEMMVEGNYLKLDFPISEYKYCDMTGSSKEQMDFLTAAADKAYMDNIDSVKKFFKL